MSYSPSPYPAMLYTAGGKTRVVQNPEQEDIAREVGFFRLDELKGESDLDDLTKSELQELVDAKGLEVEGTGANGQVLKSDLLEALKG